MSDRVLTVNAGSSSIKLDVYDCEDGQEPKKQFYLLVDGIGQTEVKISWLNMYGDEVVEKIDSQDRLEIDNKTVDKLSDILNGEKLSGIGHRFVHGGPNYSQSVRLDEHVVSNLQNLKDYDPEHTPFAIDLVARFKEKFPEVRQFACFDSGFFADLPIISKLLPLPRKYYSDGLRRYGFHGLSYRYLLRTLKKSDEQLASKKVIFAHLGSGCSLAAVSEGQPLDTTMAFSPVSGIPMSTRSGDLDPGVISFLANKYDMNVDEFNKIVNEKSGLLGVSGLSADMYTLLQNQSTNNHAAEAVEMFCYYTKKAIGALSAAMGGVDAVVFSGGIGQKSGEIRRRVCQGLDYLGLKLDDELNGGMNFQISAEESKVKVFVIATDESVEIARDVTELLKQT